ncbi:MAG: hypothetical protein ACRDK2_11730, partial [Solirubrobacteraceae bacterium]
MIAEHLARRRWGLPRFRLAQGVLYLPADFSAYVRGKRRQAVRTNIRRAREQGMRCEYATMPDWKPFEHPGDPGNRGLTQAAASERWRVTDRDGVCVCEALLTVDGEVALLHALVAHAQHARWLLHAAMVERLCASSCRMLLTNSHDVLLLSPGQQHFQHLLGYSIARLHPQPPRAATVMRERLQAVALVAAGVMAIVGSQALAIPFRPAGHRALVWLTALVAIR